MKIYQTQQLTNQDKSLYKNNSKLNFRGAIDSSMRFLATNQSIGANGVDFTFMVTPRTVNDMVNRSPQAGIETMRREVLGTVNDSSIGLVGAGIGALIAAMGLNKKYSLNLNEIFTAPKTLDVLAQNKADQIKNNQSQLEYIRNTMRHLSAYNPTSSRADNDGFVKISEKVIDETSEYIDKALREKVDFHKWTKDSTEEARTVIMNKITEDTGAQARYILRSSDKKIASETTLKTVLNDIFIVSDAFNKDKIKSEFEKQIKSGAGIDKNMFIKELSRFKNIRSILGFGIASLIGFSVQPLNIYLTKLKTGSDGFVGVEGRSKDNSNGFKGLKGIAGLAFTSMILQTMGASILSVIKSPALFMDKIAFTGKIPTVNQLKGVYGITIISRIMVARDKDELREVLTKDTLGYLSWLVLGDIVNKLVADKMDKSVMNYKPGFKDVKNPFKRTFNSALKTRDEILIETLAKNNIQTTKKSGNKIIAKTFNELLKEVDNLAPEIRKATKKNLKVLNIAQASGYLFSGLVLGLGIPNLNIYITNTLDKKRKAKALKLKENNVQLNA